jgi:magnesium transporter
MISIYRKTTSSDTIQFKELATRGDWVYIVEPKQDEITLLTEKYEIPPHFITASLDENERPRIDKENGHTLFIIRIPVIGPIGYEVIALGIIITKENIFTICAKENDVMADFSEGLIARFCTTKKLRFVLQIIKNANKYYDKYLHEIDKFIDVTEKQLLSSYKNEEVVKFLRMQKTAVYFNTAVVTNDKMMNKMITMKDFVMYDEDKDLLEDLIVETQELVETVNIYNNLLSSTMDAYTSIISNNLNDVMKFLTILTVFLSIPTIVGSLYGMNILLPFQEAPWAFWFVLGIAGALGLFLASLFYKRKYF